MSAILTVLYDSARKRGARSKYFWGALCCGRSFRDALRWYWAHPTPEQLTAHEIMERERHAKTPKK